MNADGTSLSTSPRNTSYLTCAGGRIGYDIGGVGPLLVLVPGTGDLLAGYRFPAPGAARGGIPGLPAPTCAATATATPDVAAPALVVMAEQDPDFPDPAGEAGWIARILRAQVVMVPEAGHYP